MFERITPVAAVACLALAACGGDDDAASTTTTTVLVEAEPEVADTTTTSTTTTTTTTVAPLVVEGATVVVANASIVGGSAGRMTDALGQVGFTTAEPTNATEKLADSIVHHTDDEAAAAVARSVALALGDVEVAPMPDPIPTESGDLGDAQVLVLLGDNQADQPLTDPAATAGDDTEADGTDEGTEADGDEAEAGEADEAVSVETNGLTVVVANASGVSGSAGRMTDRLEAAGFTVGAATNGVVQLADSVVHYSDAEGAQEDAETLAAALGGVEVEPMPDEIPTESSELDGDVLLLLGTNQADQSLESLNP